MVEKMIEHAQLYVDGMITIEEMRRKLCIALLESPNIDLDDLALVLTKIVRQGPV
jgi:hypothetical protein